MTKTIYIDGLPVEVTKKRIKRMTMRIKEPDARIVVSAPYLTPDREIIAFVRAKRGWRMVPVNEIREMIICSMPGG